MLSNDNINTKILSFFVIRFSFIFWLVSIFLYILRKISVIKNTGYLPISILLFFSFIALSISIVFFVRDKDTEKKLKIKKILSDCLLINIWYVIAFNILNLVDPTIIQKTFFKCIFNINLISILMSVFVGHLLFKDLNLEQKTEDKKITKYIFILVLLLFVTLGFLLRFYKIDYMTPIVDEFYHLLAGKRFLLENTFNYIRAPFISYIVGILFKINDGISLLLARIPGVLVGSITIGTIYLLGKKLNKTVALISAFLLSTLPLAIGMSRFIREYVFFFFVVILYILWENKILEKIVIKEEKKSIALLVQVFLFLTIPMAYFFLVERSNFIIQLYLFIIIYLISFLSFEEKIIEKIKNIKYLKTKIFSLFFLGVIFLYILFTKVMWLFKLKIPENIFQLPVLNYFDALFNPTFHARGVSLMWFSSTIYPTFFIFSLFIFTLFHFYKNKYYIASFLCFFSTLIPFLYFAEKYYAIRYVFYSIIFYIIIFACSIFGLIKVKNIYENKVVRSVYLILLMIMLATVFNPLIGIRGLRDEKIGITDPKKELLSYNYADLFEKLDSLGFTNGEFIITSEGLVNAFMYYMDEYKFINNPDEYPLMRFPYKKESDTSVKVLDMSNIYVYYYLPKNIYNNDCFDNVCELDEKERINKIINEQASGWIIIDKDRNRNWNPDGFPLKNFSAGKKTVVFAGSTDGFRGFDIYFW